MPTHLPHPDFLGPDPEPLTDERFARILGAVEPQPVLRPVERPESDRVELRPTREGALAA
jgi:hypothetical protein